MEFAAVTAASFGDFCRAVHADRIAFEIEVKHEERHKSKHLVCRTTISDIRIDLTSSHHQQPS